MWQGKGCGGRSGYFEVGYFAKIMLWLKAG